MRQGMSGWEPVLLPAALVSAASLSSSEAKRRVQGGWAQRAPLWREEEAARFPSRAAKGLTPWPRAAGAGPLSSCWPLLPLSSSSSSSLR